MGSSGMGSSGGGYFGGGSPAGGVSSRSYSGPRSGDVGGSAKARTNSPSVGQPVPVSERPRGDGPIYGQAAPRGTVPNRQGGTVVDIYPYGYDPYGTYGYYNGAYGYFYGPYRWSYYGNPWFSPFWDYGWYLWGGAGTYYSPSPAYTGSPLGSIRLRVKPAEAEVYVDGTYYGKVDKYDGRFDHLDLPAGTHLLEIRAEGYQTIQVSMRVLPGVTVTYSGEMKAVVVK